MPDVRTGAQRLAKYHDSYDAGFHVRTRVEITPVAVEVYLSGAHDSRRWGGLVLAALAWAFAASGFQPDATGTQRTLALMGAGAAAGAAVLIFRRPLKRAPLLVFADPHAYRGATAAIDPRRIVAVEVCENTWRNADDPAMWQTYVHVADAERALLVHQRSRHNKVQEIALAQQLAGYWGAPFVDHTEAPPVPDTLSIDTMAECDGDLAARDAGE